MNCKLLHIAAVKAHCRLKGRRVSSAFLEELNRHIARKLDLACSVHNGGKITLDSAVAHHVGIDVR